MPDYRDHLDQAHGYLELAAQTAEGRAKIRKWAADVAAALDQQEAEAADPAAERRAAQVRAARDLGYTNIALSETGGAGIELYPDVPGAGPGLAGAAGDGGTMQYDPAAIYQAAAQDEIDRYALMMQGRRPGPARPQYAGLSVSEPSPLDEADADDIVQATMQLASRIPGATFRDVAEAVDEIALSGSTGDRADALVSLATRYAPASPSPAAGELDLELARQREIARVTSGDRIARAQGAVPSEAETAEEEVRRIVAGNRDMLSEAPRRGRSTLTSDREYDRYGEPADHITAGQPARGGVMHPEVERIAREHGLYLGPPAGNERYPVLTPRERERAERRARPGHQDGLFSIPEMEARRRRGQTSAFSSRG